MDSWVEGVREIQHCRICRNPLLEPVLDLGRQALACLFPDGRPHNQLDSPIPLKVVRCGGPGGCGFLQLRHTVPGELMFRDYGYRSGVNTTMRLHLQALVAELESRMLLQAGDVVVDVGANDGTTLLAFSTTGLIRVGFEPSDIRPDDPDHGILYIPEFMNRDAFARVLPGKRARVVTSIAMFYDIDDPGLFCREVADILADDGLWLIEMGYWGHVLENNGFDSICHEHLGYYSLAPLQVLLERTGFDLHDVAFNGCNGGSVRCYVCKRDAGLAAPAENLQRIRNALDREISLGYGSQSRFARFRKNVVGIKEHLLDILEGAAASGQTVYGYGASTKGNVLLQFCGIGPRHLRAIADRNPRKHGRRTPATGIPICSEEEMRAAAPELLLVLPWHFLDEFLEREAEIRSRGTRFIVPFPEVRLV